MSVRLEVATEVRAPVTRVWDELVDWAGQSRWIPFTTVRITTPHEAGLGVQASALSGFWLGRVPVGLLDRFVVTGWTPPTAARDGAELEVLHLGPYFTGVGVFALQGYETGTRVSCVELFDLPGGTLLDLPGRLLLPLLRRGFRLSLRRFAAVSES
jgi:hypothetical protein